jgi:hypothetical protein
VGVRGALDIVVGVFFLHEARTGVPVKITIEEKKRVGTAAAACSSRLSAR